MRLRGLAAKSLCLPCEGYENGTWGEPYVVFGESAGRYHIAATSPLPRMLSSGALSSCTLSSCTLCSRRVRSRRIYSTLDRYALVGILLYFRSLSFFGFLAIYYLYYLIDSTILFEFSRKFKYPFL